MLIGASRPPFTGGLPGAVGVGGGYAAATGSRKKGWWAGWCAFGGAGLAGGLMGAGSAAGLGAAAGEAGLAGTAAADATLAQANAAQTAMAGTESAAASAIPEYAAFNATPNQFGAFGEAPGSFIPPTQAGSMVPTTVALPELSASGVNQVSAQRMLEAGFTPQQIAESAGEYASNTAGTAASPFTASTQQALANPMKTGLGQLMDNPSQFMTKENLKYAGMAAAPGIMEMLTPKQRAEAEKEKLKAHEYDFSYNPTGAASGYRPVGSPTGYDSSEMQHFDPRFVRKAAGGGLMDIQPIEAMSQQNQSQMRPAYAQGGVSDMAVNPYTGAENFAEGGDTKAVKPVEQDPYYSMTGMSGDVYKYLMGQGSAPTAPVRAPAPAAAPAPAPAPAQATDAQSAVNRTLGGIFKKFKIPSSFGAQPGQGGEYVDDTSGLIKSYTFDPVTGGFTSVAPPKKVWQPYEAPDEGNYNIMLAQGGIASLAQGGPSHLGDYSDGGRLLRGPGDGVSDSIPASIGDKRPARLADGEFVVPARIVSELGNGSTEAGARKLYAMMDRVQKARAKTTGKNRVAANTKAERLLPV